MSAYEEWVLSTTYGRKDLVSLISLISSNQLIPTDCFLFIYLIVVIAVGWYVVRFFRIVDGEMLQPKRFNSLNHNSETSGIVCCRYSQKKKFRVHFSVFVKQMFIQFFKMCWYPHIFKETFIDYSFFAYSVLFKKIEEGKDYSSFCNPCICHCISIVVPSLRFKDKTRLCPFPQAGDSE